MTRREMGAAVSVMWVIFLIVLLLGAGGYIYAVQSEIEAANRARDAAQVDLRDFEETLIAERQAHQALSEVIGFRDPAADNVNSSVEAIQTRVEELRGKFPNDIGAQDKSVELMWQRLVAIADKHAAAAEEARASFATENAKRAEQEQNKTDIRSTLDEQLAQAQADLRDERDRAESQKGQDDSRIAGLEERLDQKEAERRQLQGEFDTRLAEMQQERSRVEGRVTELSSKVKLLGVDDDPWAVDGRVVDVGDQTGLVYVDVGSKDLLRSGVRFDVFRFGKGGEMIRKGSVEIRQVFPEYAMARVSEELERLDPIAPGDVIASPQFNRQRSKVFALIGNFPVYGKSFLERRLEDLGAEVEPDVNSHVDFVILGQRGLEDDAPELTELPEYKRAQELNIQMLRVADLERFLRP